jgi:hypothetical protein
VRARRLWRPETALGAALAFATILSAAALSSSVCLARDLSPLHGQPTKSQLLDSPVEALTMVLRHQAERLGSNFVGLVAWPRYVAPFEEALERNRQALRQWHLREVIGQASVDQFGFRPSLPLLMDVDYRPRPMPITFGACNDDLMRRNAEFYHDPARAPKFVLTLIGTIDGRFVPQDDALALLEILRHYRPVQSEEDVLLMGRVPGDVVETRRPVGQPQVCGWNESISLPDTGRDFLWCKVDIRPSLWGAVRSFLYKPRLAFIVLESKGRPLATMWFVTNCGRTGFLARPLILNDADLVLAYPGQTAPKAQGTPQPDAIRFVTQEGDQGSFDARIEVSFEAIERPGWFVSGSPPGR